MTKILVVPDVHGREFWKEPCQQWQGSIVFLGDYHDPYPFQVSQSKSLENLKELVEFYEENKDRVTCLLGNHCGNYLIRHRFADREDRHHYNEIKNLIERLEPKICLQIDKVLFSHSGILLDWLADNNITLEDVKTMDLDNVALRDISPMRGGYGCDVGGPLWGDVREYAINDHIPNIYQIFGHTQLKDNPIIKDDYADLDNRQCYIVDTETCKITLYNNEIC